MSALGGKRTSGSILEEVTALTSPPTKAQCRSLLAYALFPLGLSRTAPLALPINLGCFRHVDRSFRRVQLVERDGHSQRQSKRPA